MDELSRIRQKKERLIIGVMSGTSLDGTDLALVRFGGSGQSVSVEQLEFMTFPMPEFWRDRIQRAFDTDTEEICRINFDLGYYFADQICEFCLQTGTNLKDVDAIGFHGQTLYHIHQHSTLQSGEADVVARKTNTVVISDFRTADIAAGGTGAPLVPYLDQVLYRTDTANIALQNLGGIGNITFLPKQREEDVIAFDTGPANAILNELVTLMTAGAYTYDQDAFLSTKGIAQPEILGALLSHEYFTQPLPKSTGRETFGKQFVQSTIQRYPAVNLHDLLRTFVSLISHSIANSVSRYLSKPDYLYLSGGGAHHPLIYEDLTRLMKGTSVEELRPIGGINTDSKEAVAFALLAHERLNDIPTNVPSVTRANNFATLGKISIPYIST